MADDFYVFGKTLSIAPRQGVDISKDQIVFAATLCDIAIMFYLFHEFAHIFIDEDIEEELDKKDHEYLADYFAMVSSLTTLSEGHPLTVVYAGCESALLVFSMVDELRLFPPYSTHPPFSDRIKSLRQFLKEDIEDEGSYNAIISIGHATETIFNNIVNNVDKRSEKYSDFISSKKKEIDTEIDYLLDLHWNWESTRLTKEMKVINDKNYICPNYATFTNEMMVLLRYGGHYELIHEKLLSVYTATLSKSQELSEHTDECTRVQFFESFNKMKLIYNFVTSLSEPLATVFGDVLQNRKN